MTRITDSVKKHLALATCIIVAISQLQIHAMAQGVKAEKETTTITAEEETQSPRYICTDTEISMIEHVVMNEVGYCSEESIIAVTNIIFNRVNDERFPDTVSEVLHQENQFTAIQNYYNVRLASTEQVKEIVQGVLNGEDNSMGALYYYAPKYTKNQRTVNWFESLEFLFELEGQRYFK